MPVWQGICGQSKCDALSIFELVKFSIDVDICIDILALVLEPPLNRPFVLHESLTLLELCHLEEVRECHEF